MKKIILAAVFAALSLPSHRLCDPAAPEQVAGRTRVPDYTNVFFK